MIVNLSLSSAHNDGDIQPRTGPDEVETVRYLKSLNISDDIDNIKTDIIEILKGTTSSRVRNAAAVALVDLDLFDTAHDIIELLRRPELAKVSGTLIYAIDELGASMPLSVLARLLENGSYEARAQALSFFEEGRITQSSAEDHEEGRQILASLAVSSDPETAEVGRVALDCLDGSRQPSEM